MPLLKSSVFKTLSGLGTASGAILCPVLVRQQFLTRKVFFCMKTEEQIKEEKQDQFIRRKLWDEKRDLELSYLKRIAEDLEDISANQ